MENEVLDALVAHRAAKGGQIGLGRFGSGLFGDGDGRGCAHILVK
jgi:hypothetical protein